MTIVYSSQLNLINKSKLLLFFVSLSVNASEWWNLRYVQWIFFIFHLPIQVLDEKLRNKICFKLKTEFLFLLLFLIYIQNDWTKIDTFWQAIDNDHYTECQNCKNQKRHRRNDKKERNSKYTLQKIDVYVSHINLSFMVIFIWRRSNFWKYYTWKF